MEVEGVDLSGAWRLEVTLASTADMPVVGEVQGASVSVLEVTLTAGQDGSWTQAQRVCGVRVEGGGRFVRTVVPDAFVRAIPPRAYPASVVTDAAGRQRFRADTGLDVVGFDPASPELPRDPAAALDTDGDGHPGATLLLHVPGLGREELYIAQRARTVLDGWVVSTDRIEGRVVVLTLDQATLGASHPLLVRDTGLRPDAARSRFTMVRVPDGADACEGPVVGME